VLGYAYDARLQPGAPPAIALSFWQFAKRRLIRLHPVVIVAACWGLIGYLGDPFVGDKQTVGVAISAARLAFIFGLSLLLLPAPSLPNEYGETHGINGPAWTLFQEYVANVWYALWGARMKRRTHIALCLIAAAALAWTANHFGDLGHGWSWKESWVAPIRMAAPFLMGLLVYRLNWRWKIPAPFLVLSAVLIAVLILPQAGAYNGLAEAAAVVILFPLILVAGAGIGAERGVMGKLCSFIGQLSYPVYIIHYPLIYIFGHWVWTTRPTQARLVPVAAGLYATEIALAIVLLYAYDLPVRAWLARKFIKTG